MRVLLPTAKILDEPAGIRGPAGNFRAGAGMGEIGVNAGAKELDFGGDEEAWQMHGTIALEHFDLAVRGAETPSRCHRLSRTSL